MTANILGCSRRSHYFRFCLLSTSDGGALREKYAVLWLFFSGAALFFAVFPGALTWLSHVFLGSPNQ